jgi:hypothetical protein
VEQVAVQAAFLDGSRNQVSFKFPVFVDNSKLPAFLSKLSPINIYAISLGLFVFCREVLSDRGRQHETIHYRQWMELLLVGFMLLYPLFWLILLIRHKDGAKAYKLIPFEVEAYTHEHDEGYLDNRPWFGWWKYRGTLAGKDV